MAKSAPVSKSRSKRLKSLETNAQLVAENVASQLERRIPALRPAGAMKMAVENAMKSGSLGAKVAIAGRLNGAEMALAASTSLREVSHCTLSEPTSITPKAIAKTTFGVIGVKVWIYKGSKFEERKVG